MGGSAAERMAAIRVKALQDAEDRKLAREEAKQAKHGGDGGADRDNRSSEHRKNVLKHLEEQGLLDVEGKPTGGLPDNKKTEEFISEMMKGITPLEESKSYPGASGFKDDATRRILKMMDKGGELSKRYNQEAGVPSSRDALVETRDPIAVAVADNLFDNFEKRVGQVGFAEAEKELKKNITEFDDSQEATKIGASKILSSKLAEYVEKNPSIVNQGPAAPPEDDKASHLSPEPLSSYEEPATEPKPELLDQSVAKNIAEKHIGDFINDKSQYGFRSATLNMNNIIRGLKESDDPNEVTAAKILDKAKGHIIGYENLKGARDENVDGANEHTTKVIKDLNETGDPIDAAAAEIVEKAIGLNVNAPINNSDMSGPSLAAPGA